MRRRSAQARSFLMAMLTGAASCAALSGCAGPQSTLQTQGPVAAGIATAWWIMAAGAMAVLALVMALAFYAMFREPGRRLRLNNNVFIAGAGIVIPSLLLTALLAYGTDLGRRITQSPPDVLRIDVTGHRWWWEVRYPAAGGMAAVTTSNELRLPVGVPVEVHVTGADVIHSFWIPSLAGKMDMIPGTTNVLRLMAADEGEFRAQCAEFCGGQHAQMGMIVTAQSTADFNAWRRARAAPAQLPPGTLDGFVNLGCAGCHAIDGSAAGGRSGPVLTHFAARPTVGAGTARLTPTALRAWLADHGYSLKPGSNGPARRELAAADVAMIATLLESLH